MIFVMLTSWRYAMETLFTLLALCDGIHWGTSGFPSQRVDNADFDLSWRLALTNSWINSRDACELIRHDAHCDVIVMSKTKCIWDDVGSCIPPIEQPHYLSHSAQVRFVAYVSGDTRPMTRKPFLRTNVWLWQQRTAGYVQMFYWFDLM